MARSQYPFPQIRPFRAKKETMKTFIRNLIRRLRRGYGRAPVSDRCFELGRWCNTHADTFLSSTTK